MDKNSRMSVRISFYDDLKKSSELSKYKMTTLLEMAWDSFKHSKEYAKIILNISNNKSKE